MNARHKRMHDPDGQMQTTLMVKKHKALTLLIISLSRLTLMVTVAHSVDLDGRC